MKRKMQMILVLLLTAALLSGCCIVHDWENSSCERPQYCSKCGEERGSALGHNWVEGDCETPTTCKRCHETQGDAPGHKWTPETETTPRMCTVCQLMEPMKMPYTGQVFIGGNLPTDQMLTIKCATDESCYIKLKDILRNDVFSFFVRAGETADVYVPSGQFYVYFAYGTQWYGPEYAFGPESTYAKDGTLTDFENYSWEYVLEPVVDGNFSQTPVQEEDF